ncbi:MAG: hypothetical protein K6C08_11710 [Oscillospiraceae bacterium]|nr:hypothetical protein [Oscillospiraceae bacterium]
MAVVERLGGCCHGVKNQCAVREERKNGIETATEVLSTLMSLPKGRLRCPFRETPSTTSWSPSLREGGEGNSLRQLR